MSPAGSFDPDGWSGSWLQISLNYRHFLGLEQNNPDQKPHHSTQLLNNLLIIIFVSILSQAFNYTFMLVLKPSPIKFKPFCLKETILSGSAGIFTEKMETHGVEFKSHVVMTPVVFNLRIEQLL